MKVSKFSIEKIIQILTEAQVMSGLLISSNVW